MYSFWVQYDYPGNPSPMSGVASSEDSFPAAVAAAGEHIRHYEDMGYTIVRISIDRWNSEQGGSEDRYPVMDWRPA